MKGIKRLAFSATILAVLGGISYLIWLNPLGSSSSAPLLVGESPTLHGGRMVLHTPERSVRRDLNGDGDREDWVLRLHDLRAQTVTNLGIVGRDARLWGNRLAFVTAEQELGEDLNGDGDRDDRIIRAYDLIKERAINTGAVGVNPAIYEDLVAFSTTESLAGEDLNGDGLRTTQVIRYFDLKDETLHNTGAVGTVPAIFAGTIAFQTEESGAHRDLNGDLDTEDAAIRLYDLEVGEAINTGAVGIFPAIYGNTVAFHTLEHGVEDLNGDGDLRDYVIRLYDLETHGVTNTRVLGVFPAIYKEKLVFATDEERAGEDLNNDGALRGFVLRRYDVHTRETLNTQRTGLYPSLEGDWIAYQLEERRVQEDLTGDGDHDDAVIRLISPAAAEGDDQ